MSNVMHTCQCGFSWQHGMSGSHECELYYRKQIAALNQQVVNLAVENAAVKSGLTYFACGSEYGFDLFKNKQAAIDTALQEIDLHREAYLDGDGWDDEVKRTAWGIVIQSAQGRDAQGRHTSDNQHTYQTCNYRLEDEIKTPATDAVITQYRAEGINFAASRLCAAYNNGFIDKPLKEIADVVGMILGAKEDIAQNPAPEGLSGEYAEKSLAKYDEILLRKEASNA